VAGTIYEAIHFAVFSNFILLSAIKINTDQHWSQTQSTVLHQCHRTSVTFTAIKILHKHTQVYSAIISFWKDQGVQNITKLQCAFLQIHFLPNSPSYNPYCLLPLHNTSTSPPFQNFKQCISYITFLWREILTVSLWYKVEMAATCFSYKIAVIMLFMWEV